MTPRASAAVSLPDALRQIRKDRGWSQARLADELKTTDRTVKRWERGETVPTEPFRSRLVSLGIRPRLFEKAETAEEVERRLRLVEGEIARIRDLLTGA